MAVKTKSIKERENEAELKTLAAVIEKRGITVRREKLSRGNAFRVKSGDCLYTGQKHLFVDRRLPLEQQVSLLVDFLCDFQFEVSSSELDSFSSQTKALLEARAPKVAALKSELEFTAGNVPQTQEFTEVNPDHSQEFRSEHEHPLT